MNAPTARHIPGGLVTITRPDGGSITITRAEAEAVAALLAPSGAAMHAAQVHLAEHGRLSLGAITGAQPPGSK